MNIVSQFSAKTDYYDKYYYTFDDISKSSNVDDIVKNFLSQGYVVEKSWLVKEHDHSSYEPRLDFEDYNILLDQIDKIGYSNLDEVYIYLDRDGEKAAISMSGPNVTVSYTLCNEKKL